MWISEDEWVDPRWQDMVHQREQDALYVMENEGVTEAVMALWTLAHMVDWELGLRDLHDLALSITKEGRVTESHTQSLRIIVDSILAEDVARY